MRPGLKTVAVVIGITTVAAGASAQEIVARGASDTRPLIVAIAVAALLPVGEAAIYRVAVKVGFLRALGLSALLDLAAYGIAVLWVGFLPGGVNPWFAYLIGGEASGFNLVEAALAGLFFAAAFAAVKFPLVWWLRDEGTDEKLTITILLTNLVLFFAMSDAIALVIDVLY